MELHRCREFRPNVFDKMFGPNVLHREGFGVVGRTVVDIMSTFPSAMTAAIAPMVKKASSEYDGARSVH